MPERIDLDIKRAGSLRFHSVKPGVAVPAVFWTTDTQLRVTSVHGSGLEALGMTFDDLLGAPLQEHLGASTGHDPILTAHRRALAGESTCFEAQLWNSPVEIYLAPQRETDGTVIGTIGMAKLARSSSTRNDYETDERYRYRVLTEKSSDVIALVDANGA